MCNSWVTMIISLVALIIGLNCANPAPSTYKVTADNFVSMTEFYERYEVISQEGQIFEVREKNLD